MAQKNQHPKKKIFVIDTNIIIDDPLAHTKFGAENEVWIPAPVITEVDNLKIRGDDAGTAAKDFTRSVLSLADAPNGVRLSLADGVRAPNSGLIRVIGGLPPEVPAVNLSLGKGSNDIEILRYAKYATTLEQKKPESERSDVVLVTNDKNLSIFANISGIRYEDRLGDRVDIGPSFYRGFSLLDLDDPVSGQANTAFMAAFMNSAQSKDKRKLTKKQLAAQLTAPEMGVLKTEFASLAHNKFLVFVDKPSLERIAAGKTIDEERIIRYNMDEGDFVPLKGYTGESFFGWEALNLEQQLAFELGFHLSDKTFQYSIVGEAGTGKTFTWLLIGLYNVIQARTRKGNGNPEATIYITKPRQPLGREEYGFMPGDVNEKLRLDYGGFAANYNKIMKRVMADTKYQDAFAPNFEDALAASDGLLQLQPIGFSQGLTLLDDDWFVVDEAQNTNLKTMMTLATRGGHFVAMGNIMRPDNPYVRPDANGLTYSVQAVSNAMDFGSKFTLQAALAYKHPVRHKSVDYVIQCYPPRGVRRSDTADVPEAQG